MGVGVDYGAWSVQNGEMKRRLDYTDSNTKQHIATILFTCKIEKGNTATALSYRFSPFRVVDDLDLGVSLVLMSADRPMPVGVDVKSVDGGKGALMSPRTPQGIQRQLIALLGGQHLKFAVFQGPEQLVDMPFYNDDEFSIIYNQEVAKAEEKPERKKINYLAKITGVTPKGLNLKEAPVETREFDNITAAKQWLLGEALTNLPTPVNNIEVLKTASLSGENGIGVTTHLSQKMSFGGMHLTLTGTKSRLCRKSVSARSRLEKYRTVSYRFTNNSRRQTRAGMVLTSPGRQPQR